MRGAEETPAPPPMGRGGLGAIIRIGFRTLAGMAQRARVEGAGEAESVNATLNSRFMETIRSHPKKPQTPQIPRKFSDLLQKMILLVSVPGFYFRNPLSPADRAAATLAALGFADPTA